MVNELTSPSGRFTPMKDARYQLTRRLGGPRRRSELYGEELKVSAGMRIRSPDRPVRRFGLSLVGGATTQVVSRCLSMRSAGFESRSVDVGSLVAKVALGEVSLLVLGFI